MTNPDTLERVRELRQRENFDYLCQSADLTAGQAVIAARGEQPVAISLPDLAEGPPHRQCQLARADSAG